MSERESRPQRTRTPAQAAQDGLGICITGLAWHIDEDILWRDFGECGEIEDLVYLRESGQSSGHARVTFGDKEGALAALAFNDTDYGGRRICVTLAEAKQTSSPFAVQSKGTEDENSQSMQTKPEGCVSCLRNLSVHAADDDVQGLVARCQSLRSQQQQLLADRVRLRQEMVDFIAALKRKEKQLLSTCCDAMRALFHIRQEIASNEKFLAEEFTAAVVASRDHGSVTSEVKEETEEHVAATAKRQRLC